MVPPRHLDLCDNQDMPEKNPNWGGARPGAGRRSMRYELERDQWDTLVAVLRRDASPEAIALADEMEAWLSRCDMSWDLFQVAVSKMPRRPSS